MDDVRWATGDMLGPDEGFTDVDLPKLGARVRVRYLDTVETTRLAMLPDYVGFFVLVAALNEEAGAPSPKVDDAEVAKMAASEIAYEAHVAHLACVTPEYPERAQPQPCSSCGEEHPPSLWTLRQARRLRKEDLDTIVEVALRAQEVRAHIPFSEDPTQSGSSVPVTTGA